MGVCLEKIFAAGLIFTAEISGKFSKEENSGEMAGVHLGGIFHLENVWGMYGGGCLDPYATL